MNAHIIPLSKEISDIKIYENNSITIRDAILSDAFKNGLIDYFLQPNNYILGAKDIAVAINMGVFGHSNSSFLIDNVIDISLYLNRKIRERFILDDNLKYIFKELGKNIESNNLNDSNRVEIERILKDKKLTFQNYFNLFNTESYTEKITIFYPGYGKSWIEWNEDESLEVSIFEYDIPKGFFLIGFDYKSSDKGWLRKAVRTKEKEFFNPLKNYNSEIVWLK